MKVFDRRTVERCATVLVATLPLLLPATTSVAFVTFEGGEVRPLSIVDLSGPQPRVTRTLLVGDEPRDIVFAGPSGNLAFITTAHRGSDK